MGRGRAFLVTVTLGSSLKRGTLLGSLKLSLVRSHTYIRSASPGLEEGSGECRIVGKTLLLCVHFPGGAPCSSPVPIPPVWPALA